MSDGGAKGPYRAWPQARRSDGVLTLRAVEPGDIEPIRLWRNAQMDVLRQSAPISPDAQIAYFAAHVWPQKAQDEPSQILLAIERAGQLIGYGGLVHFAWPYRRAEVSFLLSTEIEKAKTEVQPLFRSYLRLLGTVAFDDLGLHKLTTETYAHRTAHIESLEAVGFRKEGHFRQHVLVDGIWTDAFAHALLKSGFSSEIA